MNTEQQAKLLEEIAAVMRKRPEDWWREFQYLDNTNIWFDAQHALAVWAAFINEMPVRRRPRTITISGEISAETAKAVREMHATMVKGSHPERLFRELAALIGTSGGEVE